MNAELECWSHARASLKSLTDIYDNPSNVDTIGRVNRLVSAWPIDDSLPAEGIENVKMVHKKLITALQDIRTMSRTELEAIDDAIERLGVLIALRKASESNPQGKRKRAKRPRGHSPPALPGPGTPSASRGVSITLPARSSAGPAPPIPFSRDPKARREALAKQLPLQEGRKVAFHPPPHSGKPGETGGGETDENTWILAVVTKCINQDKNRYEVRDAENQEDGSPGQSYNTTLRAIIPLPDPNAPPDSAAHLDAYQDFPAGSTVMALYPDTSCFYKAEMGHKHPPMYKLKFEDDDDQEHVVSAQLVVEWPGPG
ncbi:hypothetical protein GLOTRDRAFT_106180 [Gloeophyllum trabeum ATCC 11539]|uniref:SGF29 C-terminal domain-containing protein n=1 Tax=Gloeophyllum trabeum (strain ATCC 11539 / FP-39264 / Madison 617) TaxID=670483 RepID=S7Q4R2_GLOTA|nr:uncharacterized protein GLOTRDRAFT_106180 [Gloeophyllum trabeum ATCC 11539]EPQ54487.1 hypothetical protein GLOTRDRAFT_106180 [Gloeophyllum trabeum ATCC 11539]